MDNKTYHWADLKYEEGIYHPIYKRDEHQTFISTGHGAILQLINGYLMAPDIGWYGYLFTKSDKKFTFKIE